MPIFREHIKRRSCSYFLNAEKKAVVASAQVADIEDLAKLGKRGGLCPYYSMRYQAENADLVLLPYNYLLDPASRRGLNVSGLSSSRLYVQLPARSLAFRSQWIAASH